MRRLVRVWVLGAVLAMSASLAAQGPQTPAQPPTGDGAGRGRPAWGS